MHVWTLQPVSGVRQAGCWGFKVLGACLLLLPVLVLVFSEVVRVLVVLVLMFDLLADPCMHPTMISDDMADCKYQRLLATAVTAQLLCSRIKLRGVWPCVARAGQLLLTEVMARPPGDDLVSADCVPITVSQ